MAVIKTAQSKVVKALNAGRQLTVAQIEKMGLANPHDAIYKARKSGMVVYSSTKTTRNGTFTVYSL